MYLKAAYRWVAAAAGVGFAASGIFSSLLGWDRTAFVAAYSVLAGLLLGWYVRVRGVDPVTQLRRRWAAGIVGGLLVGALLVQGVLSQPASDRPGGGALAFALLWEGGLYGLIDALLLSVLPVLAIYGEQPAERLRHPTERLRWGLAALLASGLVTAAYHFGFAEFRGPRLVQPLIGNMLVTAGYLLTGSPLAPILSHVMMHGAAVFHGMETTVQLPPHYP